MDFTATSFVLLCAATWAFYHLVNYASRRRSSTKLPPGPYPFPIVGNLPQLGPNPHRSLAKLSKTYGPLTHLKLGNEDTIVVSSPEIAREVLQKHDHAFPRRTIRTAAQAHSHHTASVAWLPVGGQWRHLRKICREHMFSPQRLEGSHGLRQDKLRKMVEHVEKCATAGRSVDVGATAFVTALNLMSKTFFSVDFAEYDTGSSQELIEMIHRLMGVLGSFDVEYYFPILGVFDPQGIKRKSKIYMGKFLDKFDAIIDERVALPEKEPRKNDLLEALLEISGDGQSQLSRNDMKHLFLDLFVAGVNTSANTVEWVMTELLRHPDIMLKAKIELQTFIGDSKHVEESDISKLTYLQALVKESFRYHPPGPFILRGKDDEDLEINDYVIPKNAVLLVNTWAIGRDSGVWPNPDSFQPERFLNGEIDVKGHNFELLPFGAGRRICPGMPLAHIMVHLMVASLIHNFDWELEPGTKPHEVDIDEKFGLSLRKAIPLKAVPMRPLPIVQ